MHRACSSYMAVMLSKIITGSILIMAMTCFGALDLYE